MSNEPSVEKQPPEILGSEQVTHERKLFIFELKVNRRGRFLSITEDVAGRRNRIMVPAPAFADFADALKRLLAYAHTL